MLNVSRQLNCSIIYHNWNIEQIEYTHNMIGASNCRFLCKRTNNNLENLLQKKRLEKKRSYYFIWIIVLFTFSSSFFYFDEILFRMKIKWGITAMKKNREQWLWRKCQSNGFAKWKSISFARQIKQGISFSRTLSVSNFGLPIGISFEASRLNIQMKLKIKSIIPEGITKLWK